MNPQAAKLVEFIRAHGVTDPRVLDAIFSVPREQFVSQAMIHQATTTMLCLLVLGRQFLSPTLSRE